MPFPEDNLLHLLMWNLQSGNCYGLGKSDAVPQGAATGHKGQLGPTT